MQIRKYYLIKPIEELLEKISEIEIKLFYKKNKPLISSKVLDKINKTIISIFIFLIVRKVSFYFKTKSVEKQNCYNLNKCYFICNTVFFNKLRA